MASIDLDSQVDEYHTNFDIPPVTVVLCNDSVLLRHLYSLSQQMHTISYSVNFSVTETQDTFLVSRRLKTRYFMSRTWLSLDTRM